MTDTLIIFLHSFASAIMITIPFILTFEYFRETMVEPECINMSYITDNYGQYIFLFLTILFIKTGSDMFKLGAGMSDLEMVFALGFSLLSIPFFIFTCVAFSLSKYRSSKSNTTPVRSK